MLKTIIKWSIIFVVCVVVGLGIGYGCSAMKHNNYERAMEYVEDLEFWDLDDDGHACTMDEFGFTGYKVEYREFGNETEVRIFGAF